MKGIQRFPKTFVLAGVVLAGTFGTAITAAAQDVSDLQTPKSPLVLKAQGSFFVGGEVINADAGDLGAGRAAGHIMINQMYVQYMIPQGGDQGAGGDGPWRRPKRQVVRDHAGWPDGLGRVFRAQGPPRLQSLTRSRARALGSTQLSSTKFVRASFPRVRCPASIERATRSLGQDSASARRSAFRFRTRSFPSRRCGEFAKQGVPTLNALLPTPNPNYKALSDLAIKLKGAVLMGHSQSGRLSIGSGTDRFSRD